MTVGTLPPTMGEAKTQPVKLLVDGMLRSWAITYRPETVPQNVQWGPLTLKVNLVTVAPKPRLEASHAWRQKQLDCLPLIARMAGSGQIQLYRTIEVDFEGWGRPRAIGSGTEMDLFRNVKFEKIPPAANRTIPLGEAEGEGKRKKREFLDGIRDKRFRDLRAVIGSKHAGDIFHLWSAEKAGLDAFLTADLKLINAVTNARRNRQGVEIRVDVLSPSQLCDQLAGHTVIGRADRRG